jgi:hypothetical protein
MKKLCLQEGKKSSWRVELVEGLEVEDGVPVEEECRRPGISWRLVESIPSSRVSEQTSDDEADVEGE